MAIIGAHSPVAKDRSFVIRLGPAAPWRRARQSGMSHDHTALAPDGTTLGWSRTGSGDSVVLVHGITESAASWAPVVERLADSNDVITLDLRGHGESGTALTYDLASMAGDVLAVVDAAALDRPHLVGHSLGGAVVTAAGAARPAAVTSIVDVDQSLQLEAFKALLAPAEPMLRDPDQYRLVVDAMFDTMFGELLSVDERSRLSSLRRADHEVVLGVWDLLLTQPVEQITDTVDAALAGFEQHPVPYLALFGIDPGDGYADWLAARVPGAIVEQWDQHGHYPHLVDPDRFVERLRTFWGR